MLVIIGSEVKTLKLLLDIQEIIGPDDSEIVSIDTINELRHNETNIEQTTLFVIAS